MLRELVRSRVLAHAMAATLAVGSIVTGVPGVALAQPKPASADQAKLEQAKQHMAAGSAFYNDPSGHKCEEALVEFDKAYQLSGSWKALRAIAICELELERDGDAIKHYEEVLRLAGTQLEGADKTQIENDLRALKSAVAYLTVKSNQPSARLVATRQPSSGLPKTNRYPVPADGATLGIHPGLYNFTASAEGFPDITWQAEIQNGGKYDRQLDFVAAPEPPPPPPGGGGAPPDKPVEMERPVPVTVWIFGGLTIACAATSGTFMGLAAASKSDYDAANGTGTVPVAELEDMRSDVVTKNVVADVFLGATVASAAATAIFFFTRPEVPAERSAGWLVVPQAGPHGGGAFLTGTF